MRFVVYGPGAIGGTVGARLFLAGHDVVLIARGAHLMAIQRAGLAFTDPIETVTVKIPTVANPAEIDFGEDHVVLLTMKTQDTVPALEELQAATRGRDIAIACVQNGVENERLALRRFRRVYATLVILPATHLRPGVVESHSRPSGVLDTGNYPEGADDTAVAIAAALATAGFHATPDPVIMRMKYAKLLQALANTIHAAIGTTDGAEDILRAARAEAIACFRAAGIDCASDDEFRKRREALSGSLGAATTRPIGASSWQSLARGTGTLEADYLNGEISLLGSQYGVDTPVNRALQIVAAALVASKSPPASMDASELRRQVLG